MDYDQTRIAQDYDLARGYRGDQLQIWLDACRVQVPSARHIMDLGCGTGRFTQALADFYGANVLGVDPSETMLVQARAKAHSENVQFAKGAAESIPAPDGSTDLIFSSMSFHHWRDRKASALECKRVLRPNGVVTIRNSTDKHFILSPYARFFPDYMDVIGKHIPTQAEIVTAFEQNGFALRAHDLISHLMATNWSDLAEKAALRADSTLLRLDDTAFKLGLERMTDYARQNPADEQICMPIDLFTFEISRSKSAP